MTRALGRNVALVATILVGVAAAPAAAHADVSRAECAEAYERAQYMRRETKLRAAQEALIVCAQAACPAATRNDCVPWLAEVEKAVPTIVIAVRDENDRDHTDAKVSIDGAARADAASGFPLPVDPGPHAIRAELPDGTFAEEQIIARVGEKNRSVALVVKRAAAAVASPAPVVVEPPAETPSRSIVLPLGLTVLGVVGLGAAVGFGLSARSDADDLRSTCSPRCSDDQIGSVESKLLLSDVALGIGIVSLAVATYFWLKPVDRAKTSAVAVGAGQGTRGSFAIRF
ncbi:MAG: hypothetical protein KF819_10160 [Labilithrix sp.]|nr:hypothetical protein [Labilithrix sp.]